MRYLDTSILVAALTHERRTGEIQRWLAGQAPEELTISEWSIVEFSSALALKLRSNQLQPEHRAAALAMFTRLTEDSLTVLPVSGLDFRTAARFADQHTTGLRSGDALHLGIVAHHGAHLITLDQPMATAAPAAELGCRPEPE